jgi:ribosome-associated protein
VTPQRVEVRDDPIRLGQFLKLAGAIDQGSDVKELLTSRLVLVNGDVETRRGRQLRPGDEVTVARTTYTVASAG